MHLLQGQTADTLFTDDCTDEDSTRSSPEWNPEHFVEGP